MPLDRLDLAPGRAHRVALHLVATVLQAGLDSLRHGRLCRDDVWQELVVDARRPDGLLEGVVPVEALDERVQDCRHDPAAARAAEGESDRAVLRDDGRCLRGHAPLAGLDVVEDGGSQAKGIGHTRDTEIVLLLPHVSARLIWE